MSSGIIPKAPWESLSTEAIVSGPMINQNITHVFASLVFNKQLSMYSFLRKINPPQNQNEDL